MGLVLFNLALVIIILFSIPNTLDIQKAFEQVNSLLVDRTTVTLMYFLICLVW